MLSLRRSNRSAQLQFESLECRITPYTVNDPSVLGAADAKKSPETSNHTITLESVFDYANAKKSGTYSIDFSGPMTISLTGDLSYTKGGIQITGQRDSSGPTVKIMGGGLLMGNGSKATDLQITGAPGTALQVGDGSTVKGCVLSGDGAGVTVKGNGAKITGNLIGVTPDGKAAMPNSGIGVFLVGSSNTVGGTDSADRNIISANSTGVQISGSSAGRPSGNKVLGNYIGTSQDGKTALANTSYGIMITGDSNIIGGTTPEAGNLVVAAKGSGAAGQIGIYLLGRNNNKVIGNLVGTKPDGNSMFSDGKSDPDPQYAIKAAYCLGTGNLISKNVAVDALVGIGVSGRMGDKPSGFTITGNDVGVGKDEQTPLRNKDGIEIDGTNAVIVGGKSEKDKNTVSMNDRDGIVLDGDAHETKVEGNFVGTNFAEDNLGNGVHGIHVILASENFIGTPSKTGDADPAYGNTIAFNGFDQAKIMSSSDRGHAIEIDDSTLNTKITIRGNKIHDNKALSINLDDLLHPEEVPQNDVAEVDADGNQTQTADTDTGANNLQNHPVLDSVAHSVMTWELNSDKTNATYEIDFYTDDTAADLGYGQGSKWLDSKTLHTDGLGHGVVTIPFSAGQLVSATATDSDGNTSTFSIVDSDADGLADKWETKGIDFDMTGNSLLTLPGADPMKKDLFVEADIMSGVIGGGVNMNNVFNMVTQAFAKAPASVGNPDGSAGVNLHINPDIGPSSIGFTQTYSPAWSNFESDKDANFGNGLSSVQKDARKMAYRYVIFANAYADPSNGSVGSSGLAEVTYLNDPKAPADAGGAHYRTLGGNDFMVTVPQNFWSTVTPLNTVTDQDMAGTLMHELGHTLGLQHGGNDFQKYKPNYYSVMNYTWQMPGALYRRGIVATDYSSSWTLDYSRAALPDINENSAGTFNLNFDATKQVPVARVWQRSGKDNWYTPPASNQLFRLAPMSGSVDKVSASAAFAKTLGLTGKADLNYDVDSNAFTPHLSKLTGAEDWSHLIYNFRESPSYADGQHGSDSNEFSAIDIGPVPTGPKAADIVVAGSDAGSPPRVQVFKPDGTIAFDFTPFAGTFTGGVRVAKGDVNGDHVSDIIAAMGPGGDTIAVFNGVNGNPMFTAQPYGVGFTGGMNVAIGDLNNDGTNEIVVAPASGTGSSVEILNNTNGSVLRTILAYTATTQGGVTVATGDVNGDGKADVISGMAMGAKPQIKIFNGPDSKLIKAFTVTSTAFNGVNVAAADLNGDGKAEVIAGSGGGTSALLLPTVNIYDGAKPGTLIESYLVQDPPFLGGVRVGVVKLVDGIYSVLTATGPGEQPYLRRFNGLSLSDDWHTDLFDNTVDGAFVA